MILVSLGTQDRDFSRLLKAVEKQIRLGNIQEKVIVQAGETKYESDVMEVFDLIPSDEFSHLLSECRILITHGGVGTIIEGLKQHKKIIAAARLAEYGEHQNNHQKQIISEFVRRHYLLELDDFEALDEKLEEIQDFEPLEYESNTEHFVELLDTYIEKEVDCGRSVVKRNFRFYLFYGVITLFLEFLFLSVFLKYSADLLMGICLFEAFLVLFRLGIHTHFYADESYRVVDELFFVTLLVLQVLSVYFYPNFFSTGFVWKMVVESFLIVLLTFLFSLIRSKHE